jgi:hypothetical protein
MIVCPNSVASDVPLLDCCSPPPPEQPLSHRLNAAARILGFAGRFIRGEKWKIYRRCEVVKTIDGYWGVGNPLPPGKRRISAVINDRYDGYTQTATNDADWDTWAPRMEIDYSGSSGQEPRITATHWKASRHVFSPFNFLADIRVEIVLSEEITLNSMAAPFFDFVDGYGLSPVPVPDQTDLRRWYPNGEVSNNVLVDNGNPSDPSRFVPITRVGEINEFAHAGVGGTLFGAHPQDDHHNSNDFATGEYTVGTFGGREVPLAWGFSLVAGKGIEWNPYLVCQAQKFETADPFVAAQESCGIIGGTAQQNRNGVNVLRPALDPGFFQLNGYKHALRNRILYFQQPNSQQPPCCGFPP